MRDPARITQKFEKIMKVHFHGQINKLIVCHGTVEMRGIYDSQIADYDQYMNLNMRSTTHLVSLCVPFMKQSGRASITILTSQQGQSPDPSSTISCTAHAMVHMLIKCVALEVGYFGIRVNGVAAGVTNTNARTKPVYPLQIDEPKITDERNKQILIEAANQAPLGAIPEPKEVANALLFLASNDSSYTSGEILTVDAGSSLAQQGFEQFLQERIKDFELDDAEDEQAVV